MPEIHHFSHHNSHKLEIFNVSGLYWIGICKLNIQGWVGLYHFFWTRTIKLKEKNPIPHHRIAVVLKALFWLMNPGIHRRERQQQCSATKLQLTWLLASQSQKYKKDIQIQILKLKYNPPKKKKRIRNDRKEIQKNHREKRLKMNRLITTWFAKSTFIHPEFKKQNSFNSLIPNNNIKIQTLLTVRL